MPNYLLKLCLIFNSLTIILIIIYLQLERTENMYLTYNQQQSRTACIFHLLVILITAQLGNGTIRIRGLINPKEFPEEYYLSPEFDLSFKKNIIEHYFLRSVEDITISRVEDGIDGKTIPLMFTKIWDENEKNAVEQTSLFWPAIQFLQDESSSNTIVEDKIGYGLYRADITSAEVFRAGFVSSFLYFERIITKTHIIYQSYLMIPSGNQRELRKRNPGTNTINHMSYLNDPFAQSFKNKCIDAMHSSRDKIYVICYSKGTIKGGLATVYVFKFRMMIFLDDKIEPLISRPTNMEFTIFDDFEDTPIPEDFLSSIGFTRDNNRVWIAIWSTEGSFLYMFWIDNDSLEIIHEELYPVPSLNDNQFKFSVPTSDPKVLERRQVMGVYSVNGQEIYIQARTLGASPGYDIYKLEKVNNDMRLKKVANGIYLGYESEILDSGFPVVSVFVQVPVIAPERDPSLYGVVIRRYRHDKSTIYYNGLTIFVDNIKGKYENHCLWITKSYYLMGNIDNSKWGKENPEKPVNQLILYGSLRSQPEFVKIIHTLTDLVKVSASIEHDFVVVRKMYKILLIKLNPPQISIHIGQLDNDINYYYSSMEKTPNEASIDFKYLSVIYPICLKQNSPSAITKYRIKMKKFASSEKIEDEFFVYKREKKDLFELSANQKLTIKSLPRFSLPFFSLSKGNFLNLFGSSETNEKITVNFFEKENSITLNEERITKLIHISAVKSEENIFVFLGFEGNLKNEIRRFNPKNNSTDLHYEFEDKRRIDDIHPLGMEKFLISLGDMIYKFDIIGKVIQSVPVSEDYCAKFRTHFRHRRVGNILVCGGMETFTLYLASAQVYNSLDFSNPLKNVMIDQSVIDDLKTLKPHRLLSSNLHPNYFALVSQLEDKIVLGNSFKLANIRIYEVTEHHGEIEIFIVEKSTISLEPTSISIHPYIVGSYLVIGSIYKDQHRVREKFEIYEITSGYDLTRSKRVDIGEHIYLGIANNDAIVTSLSSNRLFRDEVTEKLVMKAKIKVQVPNEIEDTYFGRNEKTISVLTVLDPELPSLTCINTVKLPNENNLELFGAFHITIDGEIKQKGILSKGIRYGEVSLFLLQKHDFEVSFNLYESSKSIISDSHKTNMKFNLQAINYESGRDDSTKKSEIEFNIITESPIALDLKGRLGKEIILDLNQQNELRIPLFSDNLDLDIVGSLVKIDFTYDSELEHLTEVISAEYGKPPKQISPEIIRLAKNSLIGTLDFSFENMGFDFSQKNDNSFNSQDFIDIIQAEPSIVYTKNSKRAYKQIFLGARKITIVKVAISYETFKNKTTAYIQQMAEVLVLIKGSSESPNLMKVFVMDNMTTFEGDTVSEESLKKRNKVIDIPTFLSIDFNQISIKKSINGFIIARKLKESNIYVEIHQVRLYYTEKNGVIPFTNKEYIEKIWAIHLDFSTTFYYKINPDNTRGPLVQRSCIGSLAIRQVTELYIICYVTHAEIQEKIIEGKINSTKLTIPIPRQLIESENVKDLHLRFIEHYSGHLTNRSLDLVKPFIHFVLKFGSNEQFLILLNPDIIKLNTNRCSIFIKKLFNPLAGLLESKVLDDLSMGNIFIKPYVLGDESKLIFYYLNQQDMIANSIAVNSESAYISNEGEILTEDQMKVHNPINPLAKDENFNHLNDIGLIQPIYIQSLPGTIDYYEAIEVFAKGEEEKPFSLMKTIFGWIFPIKVQEGSIIVCRAMEPDCRYVSKDLREILISTTHKLQQTIYKVEFEPFINIKATSGYLVGTNVRMNFSGIYGLSKEKVVKIKNKSLFNALYLLGYLSPIIAILILVCITLLIHRHILLKYSFRMNQRRTILNAFIVNLISTDEITKSVILQNEEISKEESDDSLDQSIEFVDDELLSDEEEEELLKLNTTSKKILDSPPNERDCPSPPLNYDQSEDKIDNTLLSSVVIHRTTKYIEETASYHDSHDELIKSIIQEEMKNNDEHN